MSEINSEITKTKLEDLGYNAFFESNRKKLGLDGFSIARVIAEHKGVYKVKNTNGEYLAKITGKQMFNAASREDYPAVGDWVAITELDAERAVIYGILPRKTMIKRKSSNKNGTQIIATNIDVALIVESVDRDYNLNRFERYFAIASNGGVKPSIILNKIDLISKEELDAKLTQLKDRFKDTDIILTSTITDEGLDKLKKYIVKGKTYCFLGSSGVGKSSLINELLARVSIKTDDISFYSGRGKHITTKREMYFLPAPRLVRRSFGEGGGLGEGVKNGPDATAGAGGIVIDNPGMREVGMTDTSVGIDNLFDEITALAKKCKYIDCAHIHEPGCEVLIAVKSGKLDKGKYSNYINLKKEAEHYEMTELEKKDKDRQFGKFVKKAKEELKKFGHKDY